MEAILVWENVLGLPPHLWTEDVFRAIGNKLGEFLEAYVSFKTPRIRKITRVLVNLDSREGIFIDINLNHSGVNFFMLLIIKSYPFAAINAIRWSMWSTTVCWVIRQKRVRVAFLWTTLSQMSHWGV